MHTPTQPGYFSCSIHQVIWYLMSHNPEICRKSLETTSRKKGRFSGMAPIDPFSAGWIVEKTLFGTTKVLSIGYMILWYILLWIWYDSSVTVDPMFHELCNFLGWQIKCLKNPCIKNGPIWASSKNLLFLPDAISQLFQHISGLCDIKYQMTRCIDNRAWKISKLCQNAHRSLRYRQFIGDSL